MRHRVTTLLAILVALSACAGRIHEPLLDDAERAARQQGWWDCMNRVQELEDIGVRASCRY